MTEKNLGAVLLMGFGGLVLIFGGTILEHIIGWGCFLFGFIALLANEY